MKKLLTIAAALLALAAFAPTQAEAGNKNRKRIGTCQHCHKPIYSYYKPFRYRDGCVRYRWVPSYHTSCQSRYTYRPSYNRPSYNYSFTRPYSYGYGGYRPVAPYYGRGPSISFHFGGGRGYCR